MQDREKRELEESGVVRAYKKRQQVIVQPVTASDAQRKKWTL